MDARLKMSGMTAMGMDFPKKCPERPRWRWIADTFYLDPIDQHRMTPWDGARSCTSTQPFLLALHRSFTLLNPALFLESDP